MEENNVPRTPVRSDAEELAYQERRRIPPRAPRAKRLMKNSDLVIDGPFPEHFPNMGAEIAQRNLFQNNSVVSDENFLIPVHVVNWFVGLNSNNQNSVVNIFRDLIHPDNNGQNQ